MGHSINEKVMTVLTNYSSINDFLKIFKYALIYNATYAVDIFFFLSAFLMGYLMLKQMHRSNEKVNVILIYIHRLFRLYPALMLGMLIFTFILPALSTGPFSHLIYNYSNICKHKFY